MDDVNDICLAPFRRVLGEANLAMDRARGNERMQKAARMLFLAGEFALEQLETPCARRYKEHDERFIDALRNNEKIKELRKRLYDQVYIFHRDMMSSDFNAKQYEELERVTSDVYLEILEVVISMNLEGAPFGRVTLHPSLIKQLAELSPTLPPNHTAPATPPCTSMGSSHSTPPETLPGSHGRPVQDPARIFEHPEHCANGALPPGSGRRNRLSSSSPSPRPPIPDEDVGVDLLPETYDRRMLSCPADQDRLSLPSPSPRLPMPNHDVGLDLVPDVYGRRPVPRPADRSSADCAIDGTSSFHLLGGFCKGAESVVLGVSGVRKRGRIAGIVGSNKEAKCTACDHEVSCKEIEEDDDKQESGNRKHNRVRYRLRFFRKSHVHWKRRDEMLYACVFCVRVGRTIDPSDPTVFIDARSLLLHIARHSRPLPEIPGFVIIEAPAVPPEHRNDYDLHLPEPPSAHPVQQRGQNVSSRPKGVVKKTQRRFHNQRQLPDKSRVLEVMVGARVTGLEWPDKYKGEWCSGWHDGLYGSIPFDVLQLEPPPACNTQENGTSRVKAKARFKFSHEDKKKTKWLNFYKDETITNISWVYPEHWCWSGTNSKGDWGHFPKAFVTNLDGEVAI